MCWLYENVEQPKKQRVWCGSVFSWGKTHCNGSSLVPTRFQNQTANLELLLTLWLGYLLCSKARTANRLCTLSLYWALVYWITHHSKYFHWCMTDGCCYVELCIHQVEIDVLAMNIIQETYNPWESLFPWIRAIKHNCGKSYKWTILALETRVEHMVDIVCLEEPWRESKKFEIRHTAYEITKRNRVWIVMHKGSSLTVEERMDLSNDDNNDVIVTDIQESGENDTRIVNGHYRKETLSWERRAWRLGW